MFSNTHPYYPSSCTSCTFNKGFKNKAASFFTNKEKDCNNCKYINGCLERMSNTGFKLEKIFSNGGKLYIHPDVDIDKDDYKAMKRICL